LAGKEEAIWLHNTGFAKAVQKGIIQNVLEPYLGQGSN